MSSLDRTIEKRHFLHSRKCLHYLDESICGSFIQYQSDEIFIIVYLAKSFCTLIEYVQINTFRSLRLFASSVSFLFFIFLWAKSTKLLLDGTERKVYFKAYCTCEILKALQNRHGQNIKFNTYHYKAIGSIESGKAVKNFFLLAIAHTNILV